MKKPLNGVSFRVRNKQFQQKELIYLECLSYFKASIIIFFILSAIIAMLHLFASADETACWALEIISTASIFILGVLTLISKWRMDYVGHQLPW